MTRSKVKHTPIIEEDERKTTMRKGSDSLFKRSNELSMLCDIEMAAAVQDPKDNEVAFWPSKEAAIEKVTRFLNVPDAERKKKMTTHHSFLTENAKTRDEKLKKIQDDNNQLEGKYLADQFKKGNLTIKDLDWRQTNCVITYFNNCAKFVEKKTKELQITVDAHQEQNNAGSGEATDGNAEDDSSPAQPNDGANSSTGNETK